MGTTIFLDESYDQPNQSFTILGALFSESGSPLHAELRRAKCKHGFSKPDGSLGELKYNECIDRRCLRTARDAVDAFLGDDQSRFACIVVEKRLLDRRRFGKSHEPDKIIDARIYKKFAELLLKQHMAKTEGAVLLADSMTRCHGDRFLELLKELFGTSGDHYSAGRTAPLIKHVQEVHSHLEPYQVLQICDLFCGCVLNENLPAANPRSGKNRIRQYLCRQLGVADLSRRRWLPRVGVPWATKEKFDVWYWQPST